NGVRRLVDIGAGIGGRVGILVRIRDRNVGDAITAAADRDVVLAKRIDDEHTRRMVMAAVVLGDVVRADIVAGILPVVCRLAEVPSGHGGWFTRPAGAHAAAPARLATSM